MYVYSKSSNSFGSLAVTNLKNFRRQSSINDIFTTRLGHEIKCINTVHWRRLDINIIFYFAKIKSVFKSDIEISKLSGYGWSLECSFQTKMIVLLGSIGNATTMWITFRISELNLKSE